jgi:hypothetical protein
MRLPPEQVNRFFAIWKPLLLYVNRKLNVEPALLDAGPEDVRDPQQIYPIREALWANDAVREAFIAENPAGLSAADLAVVDSWRYRVGGTFYVFRHLKKHSLLIADEEVYAVLGLGSSLDELIPFTPCYAQAVLLPFEGPIIYDSLIAPYNVYLGGGIRGELDHIYKDARERGAIITSLLPPSQPASREQERDAAGEVNARVLEEFRKHLFRSGLSPRVVERDEAAVAAFAGDFLAGLAEPRSLRDLGTEEVEGYLEYLRSDGLEAQRKQIKTSLTRFFRFLRDTGRMDYDAANDALHLFKGKG